MEANHTHVVDKLLLRPEEAAELLSIGRSKVYELIGTGELVSVRIGASRRIPTDSLYRVRPPALEPGGISFHI